MARAASRADSGCQERAPNGCQHPGAGTPGTAMRADRRLIYIAGSLGIFMTLVGLTLTIMGYVRHRTTLTRGKPPPGAPVPPRWPAVGAAVCCALAVGVAGAPSGMAKACGKG